MSKIPRPVLVFIVLLGGTILFYLYQKPHTACDSQVDLFHETQKGYLYRRTDKNIKDHNPIYRRVRTFCMERASYGACSEYFSVVRHIVRDLEANPENCAAQFGELPETRAVLREGMEVLATLAWGKQPPAADGTEQLGPLLSTDVALFCQLKRNYIRIYGQEAFDAETNGILAVLPGEAITFDDKGECKNCHMRKRAMEILPREKVWVLSLFTAKCDRYL